MRVLLVHNRYRSSMPSGETWVVEQEAALLAEAGHEVYRFERHSDDIETWSAWKKATLPTRVIYSPQTRHDLRTTLQHLHPDIVHIHNTFPLLTPSVLSACHDEHIPTVVTLHNYMLVCARGSFYRDGKPCYDCATGTHLPALRHGCYRGSPLTTAPVVATQILHRNTWRHTVNAYICISARQRTLLAGLDLPAHRVFVKHNFVPTPPTTTTPRQHTISYIGRLTENKGIPLLTQAWDLFRTREPHSTLTLSIAGTGPLTKTLTHWAHNRPDITLHGLLTRSQATHLIATSQAVILPSLWEETFGLVAIEAMATGTPPIAPAHGSFPEIITNGHDGILFPPGDADTLSKIIDDIDHNPTDYHHYGQHAHTTYHTRFTPPQNLTQLTQIYEYAITHPTV